MTDTELFRIERNPEIAALLDKWALATLALAEAVTRTLPVEKAQRILEYYEKGGELTVIAGFGAVPVVRLAVIDVDGEELEEIATITQPAPLQPGPALAKLATPVHSPVRLNGRVIPVPSTD